MRFKDSGLTLVELLLAVTLIGVIGGMAMAGHIALLRNMMRTETDSMAQADAVFAAEHIYKNVFLAEDVDYISATELNARIDGTLVKYQLDGVQLKFYPDYEVDSANYSIVARQVETLAFTYDPASSNFNHLVEVALEIQDPQGEADGPVEIMTAVLPRGRNNQ